MRRLSLLLAAVLGGSACGDPSSATLLPIAPQTTRVSSTLRVPILVEGGGSLTFGFEAPDLPSFDSTASISGGVGGGEFRWTPLASHVGTHEVVILLLDGGSEVDRTPVVITVDPADDAAPVFLRPGAGGTFDLTRDPCVAFDIEVRDDDSPGVTIAARGELPAGAELTQTGPKQGVFEWCPAADQVEAAERWTIPLLADDEDHPPTEHDYIAVLRAGEKPGCPGDPPVVTIEMPGEGGRVASNGGYAVRANVSDDMGLRDPPLLFYTSSAPDDPEDPDITSFEQLVMRPSSGAWEGRIPDLGLREGEERTLWAIVSATDNDDPSGTGCDHRSDSALRSFVATGGSGGASLGGCEPCTRSEDCGSGICAVAAGGSRCLPGCADAACSSGTCGATTTVESSVLAACGPVAAVCEGGGECTDDAGEEDDSIAAATPIDGTVSGQICNGDADYYRVDVAVGDRVDALLDGFVTAEGDLDLQLLDGDETIVDSSAGVREEEVGACGTGAPLYVRVFGNLGAENAYDLTVVTSEDPSCSGCAEDPGEEDDDQSSAQALTFASGSADFDGTVCPGDDDWFRFDVGEPSLVSALLVIEEAGEDLDLWLYDDTGTSVASSRGTTDTEELEAMLTDPGAYYLRVDGYLEASSAYIGEVTLTAATTCASSSECPSDEVCGAAGCEARACTGAGTCPADHECPTAGPGDAASECGETCRVNADCRSSEACKWVPEGRYCERRGSGGNGEACETFADCGGQRACVPWIGGTCARAGCTSNGDCESGTACVESGLGYRVCALSCDDTIFRCRLDDGYTCDSLPDPEGTDRFVCVPE